MFAICTCRVPKMSKTKPPYSMYTKKNKIGTRRKCSTLIKNTETYVADIKNKAHLANILVPVTIVSLSNR